MLTTLEDLERLKACDNGKRFIARFYPEGFEVETLVTERHIPDDFLHWAKENLYCSEEVLEKYRNRLGIQNSEFYYYSKNINNCKYIKHTNGAENSDFIFDSKNVVDSKTIVNSEDIRKSEEVYNSKMITSSARVFDSTNVEESKNIVCSKLVVNSSSVADSENIFSSNDITGSINLTDCYFCDSCKNLTNCMFCIGLSDAEYCVFNIPVGKQRFDYFVKQYKIYMANCVLQLCNRWPDTELVNATAPKKTKTKAAYYKYLPNEFIEWVKTLPNFEWQFLYKLTCLQQLMK